MMTHEIRTPMNAVVGLIRALEANHPPAHQQPILASLQSSASHLMTLLNTALDHTRLREGAIQYACEVFDAANLVREVGQSFKPSALAKQLEFQMHGPDSLPVVGDPVRFRQVVDNLVGNAVKFTHHGFVRISLRHEGGFLECAVSDSGPGIKPEDHEKIFAPFASLAQGDNHVEPGAGLGLAVSKQLVEQQAGELSVESEYGKGATLTVKLPYREAPSTLGEAQSGSAAVDRGRLRQGLRILYVEDVPSNQQVMALTLEGTGCDIVHVDTGSDALGVLGGQAFDLVLVDLQLPDIAGDDLTEMILSSHPHMPVIAVTAQSSARAAERCRAAGMRAVVLKPYTAEGLISVIAEHTPGVFAEELRALHPDNPERSRKLAATMAGELRAASRDLTNLHVQGSDREKCVSEFKRIQHQLKTAIARFQLDELGEALNQLVGANAPDNEHSLLERVVRSLDQAAADLDRWSRPGQANPV